jgi:hypothetical protein
MFSSTFLKLVGGSGTVPLEPPMGPALFVVIGDGVVICTTA